MNTFKDTFYRKQSFIYKLLVFLFATVLIVYLFPKKGKFKYDFDKDKPWQHENLYAPFDFGILKSKTVLEQERKQIKDNNIPYFEYNDSIHSSILLDLESNLIQVFKDSINKKILSKLHNFASSSLSKVYNKGVLEQSSEITKYSKIYLKKGNETAEVPFSGLYTLKTVQKELKEKVKNSFPKYESQLLFLFYEVVKPNVFFNKELTEKALAQEQLKLLDVRGGVEKGMRIIAKGEVVDVERFQILKSLQKQYESQLWSAKNQNWIVFGYSLLVALALLMLFLFIKKYRPDTYDNNTKLTFIVFNIIFIVFITTLVVKYRPDYVYVVPICILPLVVKAFFDARLGLFTHVITVLLLGFIVPNSYEYMFLQIIVGIVTILTVSELYKRANLFISVGQITLVYIVAYLAFHIIQEGSISNIKELTPLLLFVLCGFATLIVHPLIYGFEKIFGLVSDVSLLELSDTNSKLLKELADKAPGTFHHSLNVANIAEAAANEIGANAMLVRVGALYHDIGKMANPIYYTENQVNGMNTHDSLQPTESAKIIIDHVIKGIEIAKKNKLPDRVIDFIRTHHGTSTVYYFYMKALKDNPEIDISQFQYPGPIPFSKETAILMMSDSVEAASKSIKNPTSTLIDDFVEKIINKQMEAGQFLNADITFKEIEKIKKVMKLKLNNMYHLRIEYPE